MRVEPFTAREVAQRLGVQLQTFYLNRARYHLVDRMPRPTSSVGRLKFDRAGMEAWLTRNDPRRPPAAANDALPPPMPNSDTEWSEFLHRHYAQPAE